MRVRTRVVVLEEEAWMRLWEHLCDVFGCVPAWDQYVDVIGSGCQWVESVEVVGSNGKVGDGIEIGFNTSANAMAFKLIWS